MRCRTNDKAILIKGECDDEQSAGEWRIYEQSM